LLNPTVKNIADVITEAARSAGVAELMERCLNGDVDAISRNPSRA
jgi:hypothetical protein